MRLPSGDHLGERVFPCWIGIDVRLEIKVPVGGKRDPLAVGRPGWSEVTVHLPRSRLQRRRTGQIARLTGREVQNPDAGVVGPARGDKGDLIAVRREGRLVVERWIVRQTLEARAIHMHAIEIGFAGTVAFRCKCDPLPIR